MGMRGGVAEVDVAGGAVKQVLTGPGAAGRKWITWYAKTSALLSVDVNVSDGLVLCALRHSLVVVNTSPLFPRPLDDSHGCVGGHCAAMAGPREFEAA